MSDMDWVTAAAISTVFLAVFAVIGYVWKHWAKPFLHRIGNFLDDWNGEEARPGFPKRPGVPERLAAIEQEQKRVSHEVQTNSGSSLKDAVKRVEATQEKHSEQIGLLLHAFGSFVGREQTARIEGHKAQQELWQTLQQRNGEGGE